MAAAAPRRCSAGAGRARPSRSRSGRSTSSPSTATPRRAGPSTRPTGPASSAAAGRPPTRRRWTRARRCRARPGRCSTRSSACAGGSGWRRARRPSSPSRPPWPTSREEALALADQYHDAARRRPGPSSWPGPTAGSSCRHLRLVARGRPPVPAAGRRTSSSPARPCGPRRPCSPPTARASRACGGTASPATCRSSWSASAEADELPLARQLLAAHAYWRAQGARGRPGPPERAAGELPRGAARSSSQELVRASDGRDLVDQPGGVFVRKAAQMADEDQVAAPGGGPRRPRRRPRPAGRPGRPHRAAAAAAAAPGRRRDRPATGPTTARGAGRRPALRQRPRRLHPGRPRVLHPRAASPPDVGATAHARPRPGRSCRRRPGSTSSPTPRFGFLVSEAGAGYTWAGNSQANRLTPWSNDPVTDPPGEVVYLRDEETGEVWSPTPAARPGGGARRVVRHGQGYTAFEQEQPRPRPRADRCSSRPTTRSRSSACGSRNRGRPAAAAVGDVLRRVGAGHDPRRRRRCTSSPRSTPRPAPCWPATPSTPDFAGARGVRRRRAGGRGR